MRCYQQHVFSEFCEPQTWQADASERIRQRFPITLQGNLSEYCPAAESCKQARQETQAPPDVRHSPALSNGGNSTSEEGLLLDQADRRHRVGETTWHDIVCHNDTSQRGRLTLIPAFPHLGSECAHKAGHVLLCLAENRSKEECRSLQLAHWRCIAAETAAQPPLQSVSQPCLAVCQEFCDANDGTVAVGSKTPWLTRSSHAWLTC